ncbi:MAG TPA: deoxyribodipyrimidine photo-lyase [Methanoregulaceae archaeon]|nr:deoxyribodipyrimidine photo-lyase [Methanoregulaceae archaeon]
MRDNEIRQHKENIPVVTSVDPARIRVLNDGTTRMGRYVLYWMQSSQRIVDNPALRYATELADRVELPLVVYFGLDATYPEANLRHFRFMVEGLAELARSLESLGILFVLRTESPERGVCVLARDASMVVVDRGYLRPQQVMYRYAAEHCRCPLFQVEGNIIVPVEIASQKEEYSAATLRPKIEQLLDRFLYTAETGSPGHSSLKLAIPTLSGEPVEALLSRLDIDQNVPASATFTGGSNEANRRFEDFLAYRLDGFAERRNDPGRDGNSDMSPYLHFGQVSPVTLALRALQHEGAGVRAFLEELVIRRELAINFVRYNPHYDTFMSLPAWAQRTLDKHQGDRREYLYSTEELEQAATHDPFWNAAQKEMENTGKMQGYMRMYWGKKIIEWSQTPQKAYSAALFLNNKYEIDGRDPNGYAGVAWCFGKHDRPWKEREVFGTVRYMNAAGLRRKFTMDSYLQRFPGIR